MNSSMQLSVKNSGIQSHTGSSMQKVKREIANICIQGDVNLIFTISRSIVTVMKIADSVPMARKTLQSLGEALMCQAADVYGRILRDYNDTLPDSQPEQILLQQENSGASENIVQKGADQ